MPKEALDAHNFEEEIYEYMSQSHISEKNMARLKIISQSSNSRISNLAAVALEVAEIKPYKRKRITFLAKGHKALLDKLKETGLIDAHGID